MKTVLQVVVIACTFGLMITTGSSRFLVSAFPSTSVESSGRSVGDGGGRKPSGTVTSDAGMSLTSTAAKTQGVAGSAQSISRPSAGTLMSRAMKTPGAKVPAASAV